MKKDDLKIFSKIPSLRTDRLILRRMMPSDIEDVYEYASDRRVSEYLLWYPHTDRAYTRLYLSHIDKRYKRCEYYDWCIEYCGKVIGTAGFTSFDTNNNSAEIGYVLASKYWGLGIATEAASAVIEFGFNILSLNRIEARCLDGNDGSLKVMKKCGMTYEGVKREAVLAKGSYRDVHVSAILYSDYKKEKI